MKKFLKRNKKGFTLVELLVVVAIIAILMLIALPKFMDSTKGAKIRTFEANTRQLISAMNTAYAGHGADATKITAEEVKVENFTGKPAGATYTVTAGSGTTNAKLTSTLTGVLASDYVIEYDAGTQTIVQKFGGNPVEADDISSTIPGATWLGNN